MHRAPVSRARLFPVPKIVETVIDIVAALVIDNTDSALSITNAATMSITVSTIFGTGNNRAREQYSPRTAEPENSTVREQPSPRTVQSENSRAREQYSPRTAEPENSTVREQSSPRTLESENSRAREH